MKVFLILMITCSSLIFSTTASAKLPDYRGDHSEGPANTDEGDTHLEGVYCAPCETAKHLKNGLNSTPHPDRIVEATLRTGPTDPKGSGQTQ